MPDNTELNDYTSIHLEKLTLLVKALEILAPENFAENTARQNLTNFIEFVTKHFGELKIESIKQDMPYTLGAVEILVNTGLCKLLDVTLTAAKVQECGLRDWWSEKYPYYSGNVHYPIRHPKDPCPQVAYYADAKVWGWEHWLTSQDVLKDERFFNVSKIVYQHVIYCERRYLLVKCTADYFRHLLALATQATQS